MGKVTQFPSGPWVKNESKEHVRKAGLKNWELINYILCVPGLSPYARLVAAKLAYYRDSTTGKCCPSRETLAKDLGMSVVSVTNALAELMGNSDLPEEKPDPWDDTKRRKRVSDSSRPQIIQRMKGTGVKGVSSRYIFNWDWHILKEVLSINDINSFELRSVWGIPSRGR